MGRAQKWILCIRSISGKFELICLYGPDFTTETEAQVEGQLHEGRRWWTDHGPGGLDGAGVDFGLGSGMISRWRVSGAEESVNAWLCRGATDGLQSWEKVCDYW